MLSKTHFSILMLAVFSLTNCSSKTSSIVYYLLSQPETGESYSLQDSTKIVLISLEMPEYLKQRGLPFMLDDNTVHISKTHVWAESFAHGVEKTLSSALEPEFVLVSRNQGITGLQSQTSDLKLSIAFEHFIPTANGDIVLNASYIIRKDGHTLAHNVFSQRYALTDDGYSHAVDVHRIALNDFSKKLIDTLNTLN